MMKPKEFLIVICVIVLIMLGVAVVDASKSAELKRRQVLYKAWCQTYNRQDISYDNWVRLYNADLLPVAVQNLNKMHDK